MRGRNMSELRSIRLFKWRGGEHFGSPLICADPRCLRKAAGKKILGENWKQSELIFLAGNLLALMLRFNANDPHPPDFWPK